MKTAILQSSYIPWKGYFDIINDVDVFCFYDEVKYTKNDWRNRNKIYPKSGIQWLTIPISKDAVKHRISEVNITDEKWQDLHNKTLSLSYCNAPFYEQLKYFMDAIYQAKKWDSLSELNQQSIKLISEFIGIKTKFVDSSEFDLRGDRVERLVNLIKDMGATEYLSGPSARDYLKGNEQVFSDSNIKLHYKDYSGYPPYKQLCSPFEHYVSIFDLIANIKQEDIRQYIWDHT